MNSMLMQESPSSRMLLAISAGTLVSLAAYATCWISSTDPWGGSSWDIGSLQAAFIGCLAAAPLIALQEAMWSDDVNSRFPVLGYVRDAYVSDFMPLVTNTDAKQMTIMLIAESVPRVLFLLPAAAGSIHHLLQGAAAPWLSLLHVPCSDEGARTVAILTVAACAATMRCWDCIGASEDARRVLHDAVASADRYYNLTASPAPSQATVLQRVAQEEATAFRAVACTWLASQNLVLRIVAATTALEVLYLGALWSGTGELTAPVAASLCVHAVDFLRARQYEHKAHTALPQRTA